MTPQRETKKSTDKNLWRWCSLRTFALSFDSPKLPIMKLSRPFFLIALLAGCLTAANPCRAKTTGSGKLVNESRMVTGFHAVELMCTGTLDIAQGDKEELVVEAEDNILPLLETRVKADGTLLITFKDHEEVRLTKSLSFKLSVKALDQIVLAGSGEIHVGGKLSAGNETIRLPGSGSITVDSLETGGLTVSLEGSGAIKVNGGAPTQNVRIAGSGEYEASAFKTDTAKISVNGSGNCKVWTEKSLEVNIGGSGEVEYYGHPELKQRVAGSGEVRALGVKGN